MLSEKSRPIIEATLPAVGAHIRDIAQCFYQRLFANHPELLDGMFNRGNQADGSQQQALAGSIAAFATALVKTPDRVPESLLARIAHKHTSLGLKPAQYNIVHDNLMAAIQEVLGDAVTPEVAAAWDEVYWLMAYTLIHVERGLYSGCGVRPETVWRPWAVEKKIQETDDVVTFVVKRADDHLVKPSLPGQYVSVQVALADGTRQPRQYSLSRADQGETRQFTVKKVDGEKGKPDGEVSNLLHSEISVGDVLRLSVPFGPLVLDDYAGRTMVFISAGIGITPMAGMLSHLATAKSHLPVLLLHADHSETAFALKSQIRDDIAQLPNASLYVWYEEGAESQLPVKGAFRGRMDLDDVRLPDQAIYHLCGPIPFMHGIRNALITRGIPPRDIQYEVFGPDLWQAGDE